MTEPRPRLIKTPKHLRRQVNRRAAALARARYEEARARMLAGLEAGDLGASEIARWQPGSGDNRLSPS